MCKAGHTMFGGGIKFQLQDCWAEARCPLLVLELSPPHAIVTVLALLWGTQCGRATMEVGLWYGNRQSSCRMTIIATNLACPPGYHIPTPAPHWCALPEAQQDKSCLCGPDLAHGSDVWHPCSRSFSCAHTGSILVTEQSHEAYQKLKQPSYNEH